MPGSLPPVVCCDLDGVVWRGAEPVPGSARAIARLRVAGARVCFLTNNSSATPDDYVERLAAVGVPADRGDVLTSAVAAATLLARELEPGSRVLACAGEGVEVALREEGLEPVQEPPVVAVVVGWHPAFDFARLTQAARAVREGARFVATNLDPTFPSPEGFLPGNGALVAAVATAAGATPEVAGKPEAPIAELVRERFGPEGLMIGDRPSTDGAMAEALGWPFALVLSGVAGPGGEEEVPDPPPAHVAADLAALVDALLGDAPGRDVAGSGT